MNLGGLLKIGGGLSGGAFQQMLKMVNAEELPKEQRPAAFQEASRGTLVPGATVLRATGSLPDGARFLSLIIMVPAEKKVVDV